MKPKVVNNTKIKEGDKRTLSWAGNKELKIHLTAQYINNELKWVDKLGIVFDLEKVQ